MDESVKDQSSAPGTSLSLCIHIYLYVRISLFVIFLFKFSSEHGEVVVFVDETQVPAAIRDQTEGRKATGGRIVKSFCSQEVI